MRPSSHACLNESFQIHTMKSVNSAVIRIALAAPAATPPGQGAMTDFSGKPEAQ
jgi:hypothetical protein